MTTNAGFVRLWRDLRAKFDNIEEFGAFADLLQMANHSGIERGRVDVSLRELARRWHWSRDRVRNFIKRYSSGKKPLIKPPASDSDIAISAWYYASCNGPIPMAEPEENHQKNQPLYKREYKREEKKEISVSKKKHLSGKPDDEFDRQVAVIVGDLNTLTGQRLRATSENTRRLIRGRMKDGATVGDFLDVHAHCCSAWQGKFRKYLVPSTLYRKQKWDDRVEQARHWRAKKTDPDPVKRRTSGGEGTLAEILGGMIKKDDDATEQSSNEKG